MPKDKNQSSHSFEGCSAQVDHDRNVPDVDILSSLVIRGVTLPNRIVLSPMCQYSSEEGFADDWHLVHLGSRAIGGAGLIFTEATAVTREGRITPKDLGIWDDEHVLFLSRIAQFVHKMGAVAGIQLAHAGRKASCLPPWQGGGAIPIDQGGWGVVGPSEIAFDKGNPTPHALSKQEILEIVQKFKQAALRSIQAGFQIIEIHSAHGYLLHSFLSPISNKRNDEYGGSLDNRARLVCQVAEAVRSVIPEKMPLFVRISATDWVDGGWDVEQSVGLAKKLKVLGVDLIDTSSGALVPHAKIPIGPNYQVPLAAKIRSQAGIMTGAVGLITEPQQANPIITSGEADLVFVGREFLRDPYWGLKVEQALHQEPRWPIPYGYAVKRHN